MTEEEPGASVIIVGWRGAPYLASCLESVLAAARPELAELHVVLNEPVAEVEPAVRARFGHRIRLWRFRANLGFGGAVNFAAARSRRSALVLLNDDSVVEPEWLEALLDTAARRPEAGAIGSTSVNPDGTLHEAGSVLWSSGDTLPVGRGDDLETWNFERRVDYCSANSLLIRRSAWLSVGGMDECYYPAYFEDVDLALRLADRVWDTWYQPRSLVRHVRSGSTTLSFRRFLFERNHERFVKRWSAALSTREPPGRLETAVWAAMGHPYRVLVLAEDDGLQSPDVVRDMLRSMSEAPDVQVAVHPRATQRDLPLAAWGVRVVSDLDSHLATDGVAYDVVVDARLLNDDHTSEIVRRWPPEARYIVGDGDAWPERIRQLVRPRNGSGDG